MARERLLAVAIWFLVCLVAICATDFDELLDGPAECNELCEYAFDSQQDNVSACCKRGCRFFSLVELISDPANINSTRESCISSCLEAYSVTKDQNACNFGCERQKAHVLAPHTEEQDVPPPGALSSAYESMVDRVWRIVHYTWSFTVRRQDGGVLIVQSMVQSPALQDEDSGEYEMDHQGIPVPDVYVMDMDVGHRREQSQDQDMLITLNSYSSSHDVGVDWLGCVSRKSGLPRWLLAVVIFFCVMVTVWLCFTGSSTPAHQQQLSVSCDLGHRMTLKKLELDERGDTLPLKLDMDRV